RSDCPRGTCTILPCAHPQVDGDAPMVVLVTSRGRYVLASVGYSQNLGLYAVDYASASGSIDSLPLPTPAFMPPYTFYKTCGGLKGGTARLSDANCPVGVKCQTGASMVLTWNAAVTHDDCVPLNPTHTCTDYPSTGRPILDGYKLYEAQGLCS